MKRLALALAALVAGCNLYTTPDTTCSAGAPYVPATSTRDPSTGVCSYYDYQCPTDSNGCCLPVPDGGTVATPPRANAPSCDGQCEGLDESSCAAAAGCHAEYDVAPVPVTGPIGNGLAFVACWDIEPLAPLEGGDCTALDAFTCAQHDDCISIMRQGSATGGGSAMPGGGALAVTETFAQCAPEAQTQPTCDTVDCAPGTTCQIQCYPYDPANPDATMNQCGPVCVPDQTCANIDCGPGYTCGEVCDALTGPCTPTCLPSGPTDPGSCTGAIACDQAAPACPVNTTPGIANGCYTGFCIPDAACGPADPGACDPSGARCNIAPPACPANTVPGVSGGCWSGFCIPLSACPVPACETLTTESACQARTDCTSVLTGTGCTCTPNAGCTCQSEAFARCETLPVVDPPVMTN